MFQEVTSKHRPKKIQTIKVDVGSAETSFGREKNRGTGKHMEKRKGDKLGKQELVIMKIRIGEISTSTGEEVQDEAKETSRNEWCRISKRMLNNLHFFLKERKNSRRICSKNDCVLLKHMSISKEWIMSRCLQ